MTKKYVILALVDAYALHGVEVTAPDGYVAVTEASILHSWDDSYTLAAVSTGKCKPKIDKFAPEKVVTCPIGAVIGIFPSISL